MRGRRMPNGQAPHSPGSSDRRIRSNRIAGSWFATLVRQSHVLVAAGLLMLAGPVGLDQLHRYLLPNR